MQMTILKNDWQEILAPEFASDYYLQLRTFLKNEYQNQTIYPDMYDIFNALQYTDYSKVKALILGQDPYHGPGQAHGLAFSVQKGVQIPPSLRNIYKELESDLGYPAPDHGNLEAWAEEGVLLLNASLTVRANQAASHSKIGWEHFTDRIIQILNEREQPMVFILWGRHAQAKEVYITNPQHKIIKSVHPSPLSASRGFLGSRPFSQTNDFLISRGIDPINWQIT